MPDDLKADEIKYGSADLIAALGNEKESRGRKEIIAAMSKFPEVCALGVEPLITSLKDSDPAVKIGAAEAIAIAGSQAKTMAKSAAPSARVSIWSRKRTLITSVDPVEPSVTVRRKL